MAQWSSFWTRIGDETPDSSFADSDTLWIVLEKAINSMNKSLLLSVDPTHRPESLRFVLDDDKVHCDGIKEGSWETIKKVKHVVCNRNGCNVHSLASSVTGIVFAICTERKEHKTTFDCLTYCLTRAFKRRNSIFPNLKNTIIGLDRGYSCYKQLVSFIKTHGGDTLGTSKRTLFNIFSFDQTRRGDWDKRIFRKKEGPKIVERRVAHLKNYGNEHVGDLVSIFYRNGYGGAVLLQSTLESDKLDVWDRHLPKASKFNVKRPESFYVPHDLYHDETYEIYCQKYLHIKFKETIDVITAEQNVFEWFLSRMFSITASPAQKYVSLGFSDANFKDKDHWKT